MDEMLNSLGISTKAMKEYPAFLIHLYVYYYAKKGEINTAC